MHKTVQILYLSAILCLECLDLQYMPTIGTQTTTAEDTKMARATATIRRVSVIFGDTGEIGSA